MKKIVRFSENVVVIYESENLTKDLHNARKSDYFTRKADMDRMEKMLTPILEEGHRKIMFYKLYGQLYNV